MKALSLSQPMAWAIFNGKDIENRRRRFKFRGRIIIHASLSFNEDHYQWLYDNENRLGILVPDEFEFAALPTYGTRTQGALIGEVNILDCVDHHGSLWFFGPHGLVLANAKAYDNPIPYKGMPGLFEVPESLVH
jgi:hypothetical protein